MRVHGGASSEIASFNCVACARFCSSLSFHFLPCCHSACYWGGYWRSARTKQQEKKMLKFRLKTAKERKLIYSVTVQRLCALTQNFSYYFHFLHFFFLSFFLFCSFTFALCALIKFSNILQFRFRHKRKLSQWQYHRQTAAVFNWKAISLNRTDRSE